jgi:hypothetical protein
MVTATGDVSDPVETLQKNWSRLISICEDLAGTNFSNEQQLLAKIEQLPQVEGVVEAYRFALQHLDDLERAAMKSYGDELPQPVTQAFLLFCHRNALSDFAGAFAKAVDSNAAIAAGLQRYRDDPALPDPCLLAFSDHQYRLLYTAFAFGWVRAEDHPDLNQVFRLKGMEYLGKIACASGEPDAESDAQSPHKVWLEIRKRSPLADLRTAAASENKARLAEDVIEYLAIVNAAAAAGALDPGEAKDIALAQTASAIIADLIDALS